MYVYCVHVSTAQLLPFTRIQRIETIGSTRITHKCASFVLHENTSQSISLIKKKKHYFLVPKCDRRLNDDMLRGCKLISATHRLRFKFFCCHHYTHIYTVHLILSCGKSVRQSFSNRPPIHSPRFTIAKKKGTKQTQYSVIAFRKAYE